MHLPGVLLGTALLAVGAGGLFLSIRVNGNPLAGAFDRKPGAVQTGFEPDAPSFAESFEYRGSVDYRGGLRRRATAAFLLLLVTALAGFGLAGLVFLTARVLVRVVQQLSAG